MPLTDLIRMTNGEMDATQERASNSSVPSTRPETDFCELVWNNGQIMMQGQSSKASKGLPTTSDFQSFMHKSQVGRDANGLKLNKFTTMDSVLGDFPLAVPSCEMGLGQDADMVPWLSYPVDDSLHNDYTCDFLPELSGVTMNDLSTDNHLSFREKKSSCHGDGHHNSANLKRSNASDTEKFGRGEGSEVPQFAPSSQLNIPRSGVSGITGDNVGNTYNVASREFNASSLSGFTSLRLQKLDAGHPSTSSSFTNFPYFSRPAALAKANNFNVSTSKRIGNDEQRCTVTSNPSEPTLVDFASACSRKETATNDQSIQAPVNVIQESTSKKPAEELLMVKRTMRKDVVMNDAEQNQAPDATVSKVVMLDERNTEPVVAASSVCSGNSVDRASNERAYDLKRKSRETTESDGPSEEAEDESVGAKKAAHARASSKRTRAAEVHNLSERRRRDRINEKMRALQELIPNCNKVDKASMLDEAIEYLKTLQLQVQMLSMGAGMYMQPMMLPPGMQPIHGAQIPHFPPMGLGMGMGMGFGMNMLDVNGGMKMIPFQGPHYPVPGAAAAFHGMPGPSLQPFGHPGQGLQMSLQRAPLHPIPGATPGNVPMGLNMSGVAGSSGTSNLPPSGSAKVATEQVMPNNFPNNSLNQATTNQQATVECNQPSAPSHDRRQAVNAPETSLAARGANNVA